MRGRQASCWPRVLGDDLQRRASDHSPKFIELDDAGTPVRDLLLAALDGLPMEVSAQDLVFAAAVPQLVAD